MALRMSGISANTYLEMRLNTNLNAMHVINRIGIQAAQRLYETNREFYEHLLKSNPRGWFGMIEQLGIKGLQKVARMSSLPRAARRELKTTLALIDLRQGFGNESTHPLGGLIATVTPGLNATYEVMKRVRPDLIRRIEVVKEAVREGLNGEPINLSLPEDIPGAATETPRLTNIRVDLREAAEKSRAIWEGIKTEASSKWGINVDTEITDIIAVGIGANDMYLQSLQRLVKKYLRCQLHVVTSPQQMIEAGRTLDGKKTLVIAISRGGETEDTLKPLEFNAQKGWFKQVVVFANKNNIRTIAEREQWIIRKLESSIGGRYMREKGDIVLIPIMATIPESAVEEYILAEEIVDTQQFPVGKIEDVFNLAGHMYTMIAALNTPFISTMSNDPILEAALRIPAQLHNEGGGKISNHSLVVGPGMPVEAFAHAGIEAFLEAAMHGYIYGLFTFNTAVPEGELVLSREAAVNPLHEGLTPTEMSLAFAIPNSAKFTFVGGPNITVTMDGITAGNLSTLTSFYVNLIWPYLMMKKCNPDSNPQVALVRKLTSSLLVAIAEGKKKGLHPYRVVKSEIPRLMTA